MKDKMTNYRALELEVVKKAVAGAPQMAGSYNRTDNGYDFCLRGTAVYRNLNPGDTYQAKATLLFTPGADPNYVLNVVGTDGADDGVRRLFKEVLPTEPETDFQSHASVQGVYPLATPVNISVTVAAQLNPNGGIEVSIKA
jgi:hypothetical protein